MILVDTTVWIDLFAGNETPQVQKLEQFVYDRKDLCICGVILTEVLQGIKNDSDYQKTEDILLNLIYLPMDQSTYIQAANIYRTLGRKGLTIRKPIDCMIASACLENSAQFLHSDRDFTHIASEFPLRMV